MNGVALKTIFSEFSPEHELNPSSSTLDGAFFVCRCVVPEVEVEVDEESREVFIREFGDTPPPLPP